MAMVTQEKNGTWTIKDKVKCMDNLYHSLTIRGYARKKEAQDDIDAQRQTFLERWNKKLGLLQTSLNGGNTFEAVVEEYINNYSFKNTRSTTLKLKGTIKNHFFKFLDKNKICDEIFTEKTILSWKKWLIDTNHSIKSTNLDFSIMKKLIDRSIRRNKVVNKEEANACYLYLENIKDQEIKKKDRNINFWTPEEYKQFIASFSIYDKYRIVFETFFFTGVRCGELLGLQWKHFNINKRTLTIEQQLNNKLCTGKAEITAPKTKNAYRTILLNQEFCNELANYKDCLDHAEDDDFIFFGRHHTSSTSIRRNLDNHIKLSGVKHIRIHDLRHTHASMMINFGASPKFIMERMGHASYDETMSIYGHLYPSLEEKYVSFLDKLDIAKANVVKEIMN